jgi:hypothetical protein
MAGVGKNGESGSAWGPSLFVVKRRGVSLPSFRFRAEPSPPANRELHLTYRPARHRRLRQATPTAHFRRPSILGGCRGQTAPRRRRPLRFRTLAGVCRRPGR